MQTFPSVWDMPRSSLPGGALLMCCMTAIIGFGMQAMRARLQQQEADNTKLQAIARDATKVGSCTMHQHR